MKIISWNVNGLRASWNKGVFQQLISQERPDILCIQETKSTIEQLTDDTKNHEGYFSFFESATNRKGYSGVAIYTKEQPIRVSSTLGDPDFLDNEGRTIVAEYEKFFLINCYFPNGGKSAEHFQYKLVYYQKFHELAVKLEKIKPVVFTGDVNATVSDIDLARPKENAGKVGCTVEERNELARFVHSFVDTYRAKHGDRVQYTWWDMKTRSRDKNIGWRIDYFFVSKVLASSVISAEIMDTFMGSDHCPIKLELHI